MRTPPCPYFGHCAGCTLQNLEYTEQLSRKAAAISRLIGTEITYVYHDQEYNYRNRMEFLFSKGGIGLRSSTSPNKIIPIKECLICKPRINQLLNELNDFFRDNDSFQSGKAQGPPRYAVIRATSVADSISFVLYSDSPDLQGIIQKIKDYAEISTVQNILVTYTNHVEDEQYSGEFFMIKGQSFLQEELLGMKFIFSSQGFFQNNTAVAEKMQEYVHKLLAKYDTKNATLLDLYAGVGTFGIINSNLFRQVHMIESFPGCIDAAKENIRKNNVKNASAHKLEAHSLGRLKLTGDIYIITDPPRSGTSEKAIEQLKRLRPLAIIYISCNPAQLARDIKKFKSYALKSTAFFDMFPQTEHSEVIVELLLNEQSGSV
jgi:23S rRNA (uracil1939-C5)-methyltransferase